MIKLAQIVSDGVQIMQDRDTKYVQEIEKRVQQLCDGFEWLLDRGVPQQRIDLIIDYLANKYGYKRKNSIIQ